ncbi:SH3 domain-containing protein [Ancylobacter sp. G4_0304]|uniref:SH3 domain-containing protein n=1 Tax=Ancylobacter sp. G4_0304 TaxID=3114289 RepID=UPI0039C63475
MRFTTSFALSAGLVLAGTMHAAAVPATTTANVNVRSGPGARYSVIASLPAGSPVDILGCTGSWCQTQYGYVSARMLSQGGYAGAAYGVGAYAAPNYSVPNYALASPGTNYRQPAAAQLAPQPVQQRPFLPAQAGATPGITPGTAPTLGTNYRQPYGTTAPAAPAPGYDANAASALAAAPVTTGAPGSFGTMKGARTTIGETNVRSGPGVEYSIIKTLPDFTKVEVQSCANTWCQTDEGYISLFHLSRGPVQQVLSSAAQPLLPGSGSRDSAYYAGNLAAQATMGYGAAGQGGVPMAGAGGVPSGVPGIPYAASNTNYRVPAAQRLAAQPVANLAPGYAPNAYGVAGGQATVRANVNVRSGPGTRYGVIGSLPAGSPVDIMSCTGSWCQTQYGYVSARLVAQGALYTGAQPAAARAYAAANYALASPGTNYRQPAAAQLAPQPVQQRPFLPAQAGATPGITPGTAPTLGTNYRQPYGTTAPAAPAPGYDANAATALAAAPVTTGAPGSFGTMKGARTTIGETNVRSGPGVEYSIIKTLPDFTKVEVQSCANTWCQTDEGYISLFHLSRGPVQQVLSSAAQPLLPGSGSRDSAYYAGNLAAQATMGYGAAGQGGVPMAGAGGVPTGVPGIPYAASNTNYRVPAAQRLAAQPVANLAPGYAPNAYGVAGGQATVRANVNVRSGPGTRYGVIGSLPAGSPVDIMSCTGSWCQTQYGYVSARLVAQGALYTGAQPAAARAYAAPNYALASPGTNYRQPAAAQLAPQPVQQRPFLPAQAGATPGITPGTAPTLGTNYRQPYGTTAPAAPALPQNAAYPGTAYQDPRRYNAAAPTGPGYSATTVSALNVRSGPGVGYDLLGTLPAGSAVNVVSCAGSWCQTQYGYVSARHISTGGSGAPGANYPTPAAQPATYARASYSAPATASYGRTSYAQPAYAQPAYAQAYAQPGYGNAYAPDPTFGGAYTGSRYIPGATYPTYTSPLANLAADIAAPFEAIATAASYGFGEGGWGGGWYNAPATAPIGANWRVSLGPQYSYGTRDRGPGYWGPSLYGRNIPSNWGARPSYWGGRPTYWNMHPGYPVQAYRGDRRGNYYWSTRNEGLRPQPARWYGGGANGLGPRWQGPYDAGPRYNGRPVVWRPRAGLF